MQTEWDMESNRLIVIPLQRAAKSHSQRLARIEKDPIRVLLCAKEMDRSGEGDIQSQRQGGGDRETAR